MAAAGDVPPPTTDDEVWRYSRVDEIDLDGRSPVLQPATSDLDDVSGHLDAIGERSALVHIVDGHLVEVDMDDPGTGPGVQIGSIGDIADATSALGSALDSSGDHVTLLNDALAVDPVVVRVPGGVDVDRPIVIVNTAATPGGLSFPRLVIDAGADSTVTIVEIQVGGSGGALVVPVTEMAVGSAARVSSIVLQDLDATAWQLAGQASTVGAEASFTSAVAAFGGDYTRLRTDCRLTGRGASGTLLAAYLGAGDQMLDFRTFQDHAAPDTTSELLFKGALGDSSRSVYTGLITVRPDGRGTNAFQTNRNLKLSEDAWAESVPNLEIENNDVHCSHASTVGPVDEEQRFYLESRGVPPQTAERLIVAGFFDEVLERLPGGLLAPQLEARIDADLDRSLR
jgi:Fe-S cluster assembly protein SufD